MSESKQYAVYPGWVISRNDGDRHYIGYRKLIELHQLDPMKCFDAVENRGRDMSEEVKKIFPLASGNYPTLKRPTD